MHILILCVASFFSSIVMADTVEITAEMAALRKRCDSGGEAQACYQLGLKYHEIEEYKLHDFSFKLTLPYYRRACDADIAVACSGLALTLSKDLANRDEAISIWKKTCDLSKRPRSSQEYWVVRSCEYAAGVEKYKTLKFPELLARMTHERNKRSQHEHEQRPAPTAPLGRPVSSTELAGLYQRPFENTLNAGGNTERIQDEDVLEIESKDELHARFHVLVKGPNGHQCEVAGVGELRGRQAILNADSCVVYFQIDQEMIKIDTRGNCQTFCGMRARLEGAYWPLSVRRPLHDRGR